MAQSILLPPTSLPAYNPGSPDPSPLRTLAFSVAEAALQPDPNSPSFASLAGRLPDPLEFDSTWKWPKPPRAMQMQVHMHQPTPRRSSRSLWDLADHAKTRRGSQDSVPSPPVSPHKGFAVPARAPLAAFIAASALTAPFLSTHAPTQTRSAAPSPTKPAFAHLDQRRPPPEFVPPLRLSAREFAAKPVDRPAQHARARSHVEPSAQPKPRALPSLAQIQAKMGKDRPAPARARAHARRASAEVVVRPVSSRSLSADSMELVTPTDEVRSPLEIIRIATGRRSPSPEPEASKSPHKEAPALALSSFLRERTSGRLARPHSGPGPELAIAPPKAQSSVPPPSARRVQTPTRSTFAPALIVTPPRAAPGSPTGSTASTSTSTSSPTLPTITCTPAPSKIVRDGVESDEESNSITLFAGEVDDDDADADADSEDETDSVRETRELAGRQMRDRLLLRTC
ncbi:hypothetical protein Q5752_002324 [Cryptotrichosporon argae]